MTANHEKANKLAYFVAQYIACDVNVSKAVRTPFDGIDANLRGGRFLNGKGGYHWLNRGALRKARHRKLLMNDFEYVSPNAREVLSEADELEDLAQEVWLVCEHVVPVAHMEVMLREQHAKTPLDANAVLAFHNKYYRRCIVTKEEDRIIKPTHSMPKDWTPDHGIFARYEHFSCATGWK